MTTRSFFVLLVPLLVAAQAAAAETPAEIDYATHIAPIFRTYCEGCHADDFAESELSLSSYDVLRKGGAGGPVVVPGRSDDSRLLLMLDGRLEPKMPPEDNEAPTAEEIALIKLWIDAGAKGPEGQAVDPTILITPRIEPRVTVDDSISALDVSHVGALAAVARYGKVELVDLDSRAVIHTLGPMRGNVTSVVFSRDGKRLATAAGEPGLFGEAQIWSIADGSPVATFTGHKDSLYCVALSHDEKYLATGSYDQTAILWDAATAKPLATIVGHNGAIFDVAFRADGQVLATASADRTAKLWSVPTGERLETLGQSAKELYALAFSPDGARLLAGGVDNRIRQWRISRTAKEGTNPLRITRFAHDGAILKIVFSPSGKLVASAAEDRTIRIWDGATLAEKHLLPTQSDWPAAIGFTPDDKRLVVGRHDGALVVYDIETSAEVPPARPELATVTPRGVQSGTSAKLRLSGKALAGGQIKANHAGVTARLLPSKPSATSLNVEVAAAADVPRGEYKLTLETAAGTSNELAFYVDDLPQLAEREPNNLHDAATHVATPAGVWGALSTLGDVDHFRFEAKAGETIVADLEAKRLASPVDGVLSILDSSGRVVASNNDFDGADAMVAYRAPADGVYTVRVRDLTSAGSAKHVYRLTLGAVPYALDVAPHVVAAGASAEVEILGYNLGETASLDLPAFAPGQHTITLPPQLRSVAPIQVTAVTGTVVAEREPNDQPHEATVAEAPFEAAGRVWSEGGEDVDLYRFHTQAGQSWIIETMAARGRSPVDTKIEVLDAEGRPVPRLLLQAVRDSSITFRAVDSNFVEPRFLNWEEMDLNQFMYMQGEVCKSFRMPRGPDSGIAMFATGGKRMSFFDTSPIAHALDEPCYIVLPRPVGARLVPTGLPVFTLYYANDDDGERELGADSRLQFTAPADGEYLVRVSDVRGLSSERSRYQLTVRHPKPGFQVRLASANFEVNRGSSRSVSFVVDRIDGFDGPITVEIDGLPPGFTASTPTTIAQGLFEAMAVITSAADAPELAEGFKPANIRLTARAEIDARTVEQEVKSFSKFTVAEPPGVRVRLEPAELVLNPGGRVTATLILDRTSYTDRVPFEVFNLPHGVIVSNLGLNGVLIPENQDRREIFIEAAEWVAETERTVFAETSNLRGATPGTQASPAVLLKVRAAPELAEAASAAAK